MNKNDELPTFNQCINAANDDPAKSFDGESYDAEEQNLAAKQSIAATLHGNGKDS